MTNKTIDMNRRQLVRTFAATAACGFVRPISFAQSSAGMTAAQVVSQIKEHLNMQWDSKTYRDTFKAGDPDTPVKGIASCFMSTLDVLQRANKRGLNFVITHEPTFWTDADLIEPIKNDPFYHEKLNFIEKNGMVVWRIHDHWHRFQPEPMTEGTESLLGWQKNAIGNRVYQIAPTRLSDLASQIAKGLYSRSVRYVGDKDLMVKTVGRGGHTLGGNITALEEADVSLSSEVREWETVEYVRDLIESGAKKGLIVISHEAGEEEGMVVFTKWMKGVTPAIKVEFISTHDQMYFA
jgi:putative NIF3 family GTP cyclohydrolase 1 type 2